MSSSGQASGKLRNRFSAWLAPNGKNLSPEILDSAVIAVDANVLLTLYELGPSSRRQVLASLSAIKASLWTPHQVCLEFARNRQRVVLDREKRFKSTKDRLMAAQQKSVQEILKAVKGVSELRGKNQTDREWNEKDLGLDEKSLQGSINELLSEAFIELEYLKNEHDVSARDVQGEDSVLLEIEELLGDRLGSEPSAARLRTLVDDANSFRFPNDIPPGHADANKPTDLLSAGDYLIWNELIEQAVRVKRPVVFITKETKEDWWATSENGRTLGPQPNLLHEMRTRSGEEFHLVSLPNFLEIAKEKFSLDVSASTVREVRDVDFADALGHFWRTSGSRGRSFYAFEASAELILLDFGYEILERGVRSRGAGFDFIVTQAHDEERRRTLVEVKGSVRPVGSEVVRSVLGAMDIYDCEFGLLITTSTLTRSARQLAAERYIGVIEGDVFRRHLEEGPRDEGDEDPGARGEEPIDD